MRKFLSLAIIFSLMALLCFAAPLAQAKEAPAGIYAAGVTTAGNNFYTIKVRNNTGGGSSFGTYTVCTGPQHPATINAGLPQDILFGGAVNNPWTTYLTIRSYSNRTKTEYVSANNIVINPSVGFTKVNLDTYYTGTPSDATSVTTTWNVNNQSDVFTIVQTVAVEGTTLDNSRVRVTTTVTNNGAEELDIGIRYEWDIMIDDEDGSYCKTVNPYGAWLSTENDWTPPSFEQYQNTNDPASPVFYINGSVTGPAFTPPPSPPDKLQFASWPDVYASAFDYTTTGQTIAGDDSAMVYYWGYNNDFPIRLGTRGIEDGESVNITQYLFAPMQENRPPAVTPAPENEAPAELPYTGR